MTDADDIQYSEKYVDAKYEYRWEDKKVFYEKPAAKNNNSM